MFNLNSNRAKISLIDSVIIKVDTCANLLLADLEAKTESDLRLLYATHYLKEFLDLSKLVHLLVLGESNKFIFYPLRSSFEIILLAEYVLRLSSDKVFNLLSRDLAQIRKKMTHAGNLINESEDASSADSIGLLGCIQ
jgi:hypothetical protein